MPRRFPTRPSKRSLAFAQAAFAPLSEGEDLPLPVLAQKPVKRAKSGKPEAKFQRDLVKWLVVVLPRDAWFTHVANSGFTDSGRLWNYQQGLKAGTPDLLIIHAGNAYWLEVKAPEGGRVSEAQHACHAALAKAGCPYPAVVRSFEETEKALREWGIPLRLAQSGGTP